MSPTSGNLLPFLHNPNPQSSLLTKFLVAIGILWSTQTTFRLVEFFHLYFLRRTSLPKYVSAPSSKSETWALVTGASDGIGLAFAEELLSRHINVVLHGRNKSKLESVQTNLLRKYPTRQIRLLILDASTTASNASALSAATQSLTTLNLRILINNLGGTGTVTTLWAPLSARSCSDIGQILDITARFPTEITREILPLLTHNQPSLILNIGSGISDFATPYIEVYAGAKAYNQAFSRSLALEMRAEGNDVEVLHLQAGMVSTDPRVRGVSLMVPSARDFARRSLDVVGCGREVVWPYWMHAVQFGVIGWLWEGVRNWLVLRMAMREKAVDEREGKGK